MAKKKDRTDEGLGFNIENPLGRDPEQWSSILWDGVIGGQGQIYHYTSRNELVYGGWKNVDPGYYRYIQRIQEYADLYPAGDPQTWVPLARAGIRAGTQAAFDTMKADGLRQAANGELSTPVNGTTYPWAAQRAQQINDTEETTSTEEALQSAPQLEFDDESQGWLSDVGDALGTAIGVTGRAGLAVATVGGSELIRAAPDDVVESVTDPDGIVRDVMAKGTRAGQAIGTLGLSEVARKAGVKIPDPIDAAAEGRRMAGESQIGKDAADSAMYSLFKGTVRNAFAAAQMPQEAVVSVAAAMDEDLANGDYKSMLMHGLALNPVTEALFIGAENATGTQFYREGGREQGIWSQTVGGQIALDLTGQGGNEQFPGGPNDPLGLQSPQGSGYYISRENEDIDVPKDAATSEGTAVQFQRMARLNSNTAVEEMPIGEIEGVKQESVDRMNSAWKFIAKTQGIDEAAEWARTQGMVWSDVEDSLAYPAQGWTFGRAVAGVFYEPNTTQYRTWSGMVDGVTMLGLDPVNWIPGGMIRKAGQAAKGGGRVMTAGEKQYLWIPQWEKVSASKHTLARLSRGTRAVDMETPTRRVVMLDRTTGEVLEDAATIDKNPRSMRELAKKGLVVEQEYKGLGRSYTAGQIDYAWQQVPAARAWYEGTTIQPSLTQGKLLIARLKGNSARDIEQSFGDGAQVVLRDRTTGQIIMDAAGIDSSSASVNQLNKMGRFSVERPDFDLPEKTKDILSYTLNKDGGPYFGDPDTGLVGLDRGLGGVYATERMVAEMNEGGKLYPAVKAFAEMDNVDEIVRLTNGKLDGATAVRLADARTENEVRAVLGPNLGASIQYINDFQRVSVHMPAYSVTQSIGRAIDFNRMKDAWKAHVPGMEFMPMEIVDARDPEDVVNNLRRLGRVAITRHDEVPELTESLSNVYRALYAPAGPGQRAKVFQATYGTAKDNVLMDAQDRVLRTSDEVKNYITEAKLRGLDKDAAIEEMISEVPDAVRVGEHGVDGYLTVLAEQMVKESLSGLRITDRIGSLLTGGGFKNLPLEKAVARKITQAFHDVEADFRRVADDRIEDLGNGVPLQSQMLEIDVLSHIMALPDARQLRGAITSYGKAIHRIQESGKVGSSDLDKWRGVIDDGLTQSINLWKQTTLMAGGVRLPVYISKQVLDTSVTAMMNGGFSILHHPWQLLGLILNSSIRQAARDAGGKSVRSSRLGRLMSDNPLARLTGFDTVETLPTGEPLERAFKAIIDGNPEGHSLGTSPFNLGTGGGRGSQGQDVVYGRAAKDWHWYSRPLKEGESVPARTTENSQKYVDGLANEVFRLGSSRVVRVALSDKIPMERKIRWFRQAKDSSGHTMEETISAMSRQLEQQFRTDAGVERYFAEVTGMVDSIVGDSVALRQVIKRGNVMTKVKDGKQLRLKIAKGDRATGDRKPTGDFLALIRKQMADENVTLPQVVGRMEGSKYSGEGWWNRAMEWMFAKAGRWEDIFSREPYYRQMMSQHILDMAPTMAPSERLAMANAFRHRGSPSLAKKLERIKGEGVLTRADIELAAVRRTEKSIMEVAYNAANRREWAYAARIISPFVQAAVNGMYRWSTAMAKNPESTYRILKAGWFLTGYDSSFISDWTMSGGIQGDPFLFQDPQTGEYRISVPLMGPGSVKIAEAIAALQGHDFKYPEGAPSPGLSVGVSGLNLATPNLARDLASAEKENGAVSWIDLVAGSQPGLGGPVASIPLAFISNGTEEWATDWLIPFGSDRNESATARAADAILPATVTKFIDMLSPSNEDNARMGQQVIMVASQIAASENLDLTDPLVYADTMERSKNLVRSLRIVSVLAGYTNPVPPRLDTFYADPLNAPTHAITAQALGDFLGTYLANNPGDYGKAQAELISDFGLQAVMWSAPSGDNSDTPPPVNDVFALLKEDKAAYERYSPILRYLLTSPPDSLGRELNFKLWGYQQNEGERTRYSLEDRLEVARQQLMTAAYFNKRDMIEASNLSDLAKKNEYQALDESLTNSGWQGSGFQTKQDRNVIANQMLVATTDPIIQRLMGKRSAELVNVYLTARKRAITEMMSGKDGGMGDLKQSTTSKERDALFLAGETMALEDPGFATIWFNTLRKEVAPEEDN